MHLTAAILFAVTVNVGYAADMQEPVVLHGHTKAVSTVTWSADGQSVATAGDDRTLRLWDPVTGQQTASVLEIAREGYGSPVVTFTPSLEVAAINYWGKVTIRSIATGKELASIAPIPNVEGAKSVFRADVFAMAISPDGKLLATAGSVGIVGGPHGLPGGVVIVWDMETGQMIHQSATLSTAASSVAWSADGKRYAAGTNGAGGELPEPGEVLVWDAETGKVLNRFDVKPDVTPGEWASAGDIAFSPDGKQVAVPVTAGSRGRPAGLLINDAGASIRVWDLATGKSTQPVKGLQGSVDRVVFSPDGNLLATAGKDNTLKLWDLETGGQRVALQCDDRITAIAFSPDGESLAAGTSRGPVQIWSTTND